MEIDRGEALIDFEGIDQHWVLSRDFNKLHVQSQAPAAPAGNARPRQRRDGCGPARPCTDGKLVYVAGGDNDEYFLVAHDIKTGKEKWTTSKVGVGGNCGTLSASSSMLFSRLSDYPGFIDLGQKMNKENLVEITRPGCWINIIPVGGMVLVPEAGSGCSCEYSIHASMGFLPRKN